VSTSDRPPHLERYTLTLLVQVSLFPLSLFVVSLLLFIVPGSMEFLRPQAGINKGLSLYLPLCHFFPVVQQLSGHQLSLEDLKVDATIQTFLELEEGPSRGVVPFCFLK
jgi:hypothetical protein